MEGKGSLILERPLCRDFLAGTPVRPLSEGDQYRTDDDGEIYLHNPSQSHSHNEGQGNSTNSHGQNENVGTPAHIELEGLGGNPHLGNGESMESDQTDRLPCGKPKPPIERAGVPVKDLTLTTWLLRSHFQQV